MRAEMELDSIAYPPQLTDLIDRYEADAAVISFVPDIRWCSGFSGSNALFLVKRDGNHFITDGRYAVQSQQEVEGAEIHIGENNLLQCVEDKDLLVGVKKVVVQADHLTIAAFGEMKEAFPEVEWVQAQGLLNHRIARKRPPEVTNIRKAQRITDQVFEHLLDILQAGLTEKEVAAEVVYQHLQRGASGMSFDPIVASGPNSALPHARPTDRRLQVGDLVVIDMGCFVNGYASDMTRTVSIGTPPDEARRVYDLVLDAQKQALDFASAGCTSSELDDAARSIIKDAGYGACFTHSLGHGVGLQIHEWPSISWRADVQLAEGMVLTIEPGVYLPERFGVRIEDMIRLTQTGCENITASTKAFTIL